MFEYDLRRTIYIMDSTRILNDVLWKHSDG